MVLAFLLFFLPFAAAEGPDLTVIGQNEPVILENPETGERVQVLAKVDTGADRTSIDEDIAEDLGLDLEDAPTVTIVSATGEEERPVVDVTLKIAGKTRQSAVSVNDRSGLSTPMIVGLGDLQGFLVSPSQDQLTTPEGAAEMTALESLRRALRTNFVLGPEALLALIPLAAVLVVAFRTLVGLTTFGVFAPILIALSFTETGPLLGSAMFLAVVLAGVALEPLLRALHLSRTARLAVLLTTVVLVLFGVKAVLNGLALGAVLSAAFPAVITVAIIEQLWTAWEQEGLGSAALTGLWTGLMIFATGLILSFEVVQMLAARAPLVIAAISAALCFLLGRYRGLRLTELLRFRPAVKGRASTERVPY